MALATDPRPPLPEWVLDVYAVLSGAIVEQESGRRQDQVPAIHRDEAIEVLLSTDELDLESGDAEYALTRLLDRGYLYEVSGELRITQPSENI